MTDKAAKAFGLELRHRSDDKAAQGGREATDCLEVPQEIEILARPPVDVKLDIGPVGDQAGSLLQLMTRERLVELNDRAIRLQWPERVRLIGGKERRRWIAARPSMGSLTCIDHG
jgi:hypothetical protein